jgi:ferredoxin
MPEKYHIHVSPVSSRFEPVSKLNFIENEGCLGCLDCAKRKCIYDAYKDRTFVAGELVDSAARLCKQCMRCVQECRNGILGRHLNPEYTELGNAHWKPEIMASLWQQAETGKIPVSGSGYNGPFSGPGFDDMWTDMSEIVRPTRDGIHGREYISTTVDIGRKPDHLVFSGKKVKNPPATFSTPLPVLLDVPARMRGCESIRSAVHIAGQTAGLEVFNDNVIPGNTHSIIRFNEGDNIKIKGKPLMAEVRYGSDGPETVKTAEKHLKEIKEMSESTLFCAGFPLSTASAENAVRLTRSGVDVLHFYADHNGNTGSNGSGKFIKDVIREVHLALVDESLRDTVTVLAGGGIAMAEHVAKIVASGADAAVVDDALLVAMECRMCLRCLEGGTCFVDMESVDPRWGAKRIVNLLGSWHSQLIEVLGAMGIREVRRLRGETGRVMFFRDLEEEYFAPLFGRKEKK